jgi:riboflavin kinase/FMN adenylyltransferase
MKIFTDIYHLPEFHKPVVTVGSFDGVHAGHRHLIEVMKEVARETGGETIVVTFAHHPRTVLGTDKGLSLLTTLEEKASLLETAGVDNLVVMPFDENISRLTPEDFIEQFIRGRLRAVRLVVGYNHRFGHDRTGDVAMLRRRGTLEVVEAPCFDAQGDKVSSTEIRKLISEGDTHRATRLLAHPYILHAHVDGNGNLSGIAADKLLPPVGGYGVSVGRYSDCGECESATLIIEPKRKLRLESFAGALDPSGDVLISFCG